MHLRALPAIAGLMVLLQASGLNRLALPNGEGAPGASFEVARGVVLAAQQQGSSPSAAQAASRAPRSPRSPLSAASSTAPDDGLGEPADDGELEGAPPPPPAPEPSVLLLLGTGFAGLVALRRRR